MGVGKKYPEFNKQYLWNHLIDLDHVNTIRREISSSYLLFKSFSKKFYIYVYFLITKI